jgi:hypothetical protein
MEEWDDSSAKPQMMFLYPPLTQVLVEIGMQSRLRHLELSLH